MNLRLILRIARTELAVLFYSPVAWLLLVAFTCQVGFDFMNILTEIVKIKALGNTITFSVTAGFVLGLKGIYEVIQETIYLYIPLLTMNLMSREYSSGSIKLLYSSPVSSVQIITGKFVSMVVFALIFVIILALPTIVMFISVPHVDITLILAGLLSMFLLILTYCSIGLFMTTLTSYQVVAAVTTLSALAFLNYVGGIGQESIFFREITYWLSIKGRASEMVGGLICSDDVIYFLAVILLFLWLSVIKLNNEKTRRSLLSKTMRSALAVCTIIVIGFVSSRPAMMGFYDATRSKQRTLSEESQKVMEQLSGPMTITTYVNIFDKEFDVASPKEQKEDMARFKMYTRFKPEIKMEYVYYYSTPKDSALYRQYPNKNIREIAYEVAKKKNFNPQKLKSAEELKEKIDLAKENYRFVRVVERGSGEQARLRLFDDMEYHPSETEISAALKKMLVTPVKVGAITGHQERSTTKKGDQDYSLFATHGRFRYSMINQGFDLVELNLKDMNDIPSNINILLIAEMRSSMSSKEQEIIDRFLERGGNIMIMGDVGRQEVMNPLLRKVGLKLLPGIIAQPSDVNPGELVLAKATQIAADSIGGFYKRMVDRQTHSAVTMPSAVALEVVDTTKFHPIVLLQSNAQQTWIEYQTKDFVNDSLSLDSLQGEKLGAYPTAIALTRKIKGKDKKQRIIVLGDADCFSNAELQKSSRPGIYSFNFNMIPGSFRWLCYNEFPVSSSRAPYLDKDISLTPMVLSTIKIIYCYGIPFIIGLCGIWICWRRRKR